jgi:opacity protein-like surface antigen
MPPYCDPWFYWCYPGGIVPVNYILGEQSSTDVGMDFGGGVNIAMTHSASVYVEARYHYIWGPELKNSAGVSQGKANGQFFPITFGFRF